MKLGVLRVATRGDGARSLELKVLRGLGAEVKEIRGTKAALATVDAILIVDAGGNSHSTALDAFIASGSPVLAVGAGFAWLCQRGVLDGEVISDGPGATGEQPVFCVVEGRPTPFTHAIPAGRHVATTLPHTRRFAHGDPDQLDAEGRVVLRYCTADGEVTPEADPTGSVSSIAGICNQAGNVLGILPHVPRSLFAAVLAWKVGTPARV